MLLDTNQNRIVLQSGFSLIELIVALTLFVSITALASGSILTIINASAQARASGQALNAITFAIEDIVRGVRLGDQYVCIQNAGDFVLVDGDPDDDYQDCDSSSPGLGVHFYGNDGSPHTYYLASGEFRKSNALGNDVLDSDNYINLLPDTITMRDFNVIVQGSSPGDTIQPNIRLYLEFSYDYKGTTFPVTYETSLTSRTLDAAV